MDNVSLFVFIYIVALDVFFFLCSFVVDAIYHLCCSNDLPNRAFIFSKYEILHFDPFVYSKYSTEAFC